MCAEINSACFIEQLNAGEIRCCYKSDKKKEMGEKKDLVALAIAVHGAYFLDTKTKHEKYNCTL